MYPDLQATYVFVSYRVYRLKTWPLLSPCGKSDWLWGGVILEVCVFFLEVGCPVGDERCPKFRFYLDRQSANEPFDASSSSYLQFCYVLLGRARMSHLS